MRLLCVVLCCVVTAVYSENKKCQSCVEMDVDNAKGSASVMGISMTFSKEMMDLEAKVDDNALCSAPTDETCETADAVCGSGNLTMNYTMSVTQEGVGVVDVVMIAPMIMKGCLEKEKATCKVISAMIVEGAKEEAEKAKEPVPGVDMLACMLNSCDSDGKNCEKLDEVKAPGSGAETRSLLFSSLILLTQLIYHSC